MTLVDLSEANIHLAEKKIDAAGIRANIEAVLTADARSLPQLNDEHFDAVLCMGPLYHLPEERDRLACLRECARVLKPEAPLFITAVPRGSFIRDAVRSGTFEEVIHQTRMCWIRFSNGDTRLNPACRICISANRMRSGMVRRHGI